MMEKLFVLSLVLVTASLATADLVFDINGTLYPSGSTVAISGQTTIGLYNDTEFYVEYGEYPALFNVAWIEVSPDAAVPGSEWIQPPDAVLPGTWSIIDYGLSAGFYYWWIQRNSIDLFGDVRVGTFATVDVTRPTTLTVYEWDFITVAGEIELIPEPTTVGLLALGGLFLARRK